MRMVHTREGAEVSCRAIAAGTAKDRKKIVKAVKSHVHRLVTDEWGHTVLMTLLSMTDDTALLKKTLGPELVEIIPELISHKHGRRVLLQLLAPDTPRYVPAWMQEWIHPAEIRITEAAAIERHREELEARHNKKKEGEEQEEEEEEEEEKENGGGGEVVVMVMARRRVTKMG